MYRKKEFGKRNKVLDTWCTNSFVNLWKVVLLFTMLFVFTSSVLAISGTGGNISLISEIGTVSYDGVNAQLTSYGGASVIDGQFTAPTMDGRFGLLENTNVTSVNLTLLAPATDIIVVGTTVDFNYVPEGVLNNCSLYIDGSLAGFNPTPINNITSSFTIAGISVGRHTWNVSCLYNSSSISKSNEFTVVVITGFNSSSTDLNGLNASNVLNLTLAKTDGSILFGGYTNLSSGFDSRSNIIISPLSVSLNSAALPMLNRSAIITLNNVPYDNVLIWRDGAICTDCNVISLSNRTLVFNVTGFSDYTVTSTSKLVTFDSTDYSQIMRNQTMMITANYTNFTSGSPINGLCDVNIPSIGTFAMTYNVTSKAYEYVFESINSGEIPYAVNCTSIDFGFDNLDVSSTFIISTLPPNTFANITAIVGPSSSMPTINNTAALIPAEASNVSELFFDASTITNTWQGYYGNIVGKIQLVDASSSVFYDWSLVSPNGEVYATRLPSVTWANVRCANSAELASEDIALGVMYNASDSVANTFRNTSNFSKFYTGDIQINDTQNCYAIHLNNNTGAQSTQYAEVLLSDSSLMIYTAIIDPEAIGFDGNAYDFQMIVGEDGHNDNNNPTMYYFYLEIG